MSKAGSTGLGNRRRRSFNIFIIYWPLQDPVCATGDEEAMLSYRTALETALGNPAAAHPFEAYGQEKLSLAKARFDLPTLIAIIMIS